MAPETAERCAEENRDDGQYQPDLPVAHGRVAAMRQPDIDHHQQQQRLQQGVAIDECRAEAGDSPDTPGQRVPDHGPRRRRLIAPTPSSTVAAPANSSHGPIEGGVGGWVVGPVTASADRLVVDTLGAAACRLGDIGADTGEVAVAVGAVAEWVATTVGAAAAQTWANRTAGGGAPNVDV